jgi:hypothetical protein
MTSPDQAKAIYGNITGVIKQVLTVGVSDAPEAGNPAELSAQELE